METTQLQNFIKRQLIRQLSVYLKTVLSIKCWVEYLHLFSLSFQSMITKILDVFPAGLSLKELKHYLQLVKSGKWCVSHGVEIDVPSVGTIIQMFV